MNPEIQGSHAGGDINSKAWIWCYSIHAFKFFCFDACVIQGQQLMIGIKLQELAYGIQVLKPKLPLPLRSYIQE